MSNNNTNEVTRKNVGMLEDQPEEGKSSLITLEILKHTKELQLQHGLRHNDYQRYRGYCTRRIRRLRKALKIPQGDRRHFKGKSVTEAHLTDERAICIPLMLAERAWSYSMQLRSEANTEPRKKFHVVSRLRKACKYAKNLQALCENVKIDATTKLEVEAYVAWIHGTLYFELKLWETAVKYFEDARLVYTKLASTMTDVEAVLYKQRSEEIIPSIRYCAYNIGEETSVEELLKLRSHAQSEQMKNLDILLAQAKQSRSEQLNEIEWRGKKVPIKNEKVRTFLMAERDFDKTLSKESLNDDIELIEQHIIDCKDAQTAVKDDMKTDHTLQLLFTYLSYIRLNRTIQRNLLMIDLAKGKQQSVTLDDQKVKSRDVTRFYEIILQHLTEMKQLTGLEDDEEYQEEIRQKMEMYKAWRCYCICRNLMEVQQWGTAVAILDRALQYASKAYDSDDSNEELKELVNRINTLKVTVRAYSVLEEGGGGLADKTEEMKKKPLEDRLEEYFEDQRLITKQPNVITTPLKMKAIPCKPIFFDLASNMIQFPKLDHKIKNVKTTQAGIGGFVKGIWGWGGGKKSN